MRYMSMCRGKKKKEVFIYVSVSLSTCQAYPNDTLSSSLSFMVFCIVFSPKENGVSYRSTTLSSSLSVSLYRSPPPPQALFLVVHQFVRGPEGGRRGRAAVVFGVVMMGTLGLFGEDRVRAGVGGAAEGGEAAVVELAKGDIEMADELGC